MNIITVTSRFEHPYQYELDHFEPTEEQLTLREPQVSGLNRVGHFVSLVL